MFQCVLGYSTLITIILIQSNFHSFVDFVDGQNSIFKLHLM